jgi:hypothetical protein
MCATTSSRFRTLESASSASLRASTAVARKSSLGLGTSATVYSSRIALPSFMPGPYEQALSLVGTLLKIVLVDDVIPIEL